MPEAARTPADSADEDIMASVAQAGSSANAVIEAVSAQGASQSIEMQAASPFDEAPLDNAMPTVSIHIPFEAAPQALHRGLRTLAKHHIRAGALKFCERIGHGWMGAGGQKDALTGKGRKGEWWWNLSFTHDDSLPLGRFEISTPDDLFFDPNIDAAASSPCEKPYIVNIKYSRMCEAFRGLGHVLGLSRSLIRPVASMACTHPNLEDSSGKWALDPLVAQSALATDETAQFETLGTMIDVSRNGVLKVDSVKYLCRKLSLWGYNMLQLYTEDTYEIEGEPFFGYLRGAYTQGELREIDDYAYDLGIECVPCIQTLGHLGQVLQWPRFLALKDTTEVLLAELPETYDLLTKMISTATRPFRSKRIHLGQDETHGLGHGRYHSVFGRHNYKDPTRIFIDHLRRVNDICLQLGLEPMIWSDMLFCLNAKNNSLLGYYDSAQPSAPEVAGLPPNIDLVYWDYYHLKEQNYRSRIESHKLLNKGKAPWMAAGSWTWTRFWTALPFTFATCRASQNACKASGSGVKNVFLTIWGDEGNEVDLWSSLPAWAYYADHAYTKQTEVDIPLLKAKFDGITGGNFDDFVIASRLDDQSPETQTLDDRVQFTPNTSKWMMWEEPFFGFVSPSVAAAGIDLETHFEELSMYLQARLSDTPSPAAADGADVPPRCLSDHPFNARLRFPQLISQALAIKAGLRAKLSAAYSSEDWALLDHLAGPSMSSALSSLIVTARRLHNYHRQLWMSMYKPFGWETLDLRWGGLIARLTTMHHRIARFLSHVENGGKVGQSLFGNHAAETGVMLNSQGAELDDYEEEVTEIPELAVRLEVAYPSAVQLLDYHRVSRPTYC
ncbi:unnamed protein product [Sympodiomycopsis kandeliae]